MKKRALVIIAFAAFLAATVAGKEREVSLPETVAGFTAAVESWDGAALSRSAEELERLSRRLPESFPAHYWLGAARFHQALYLIDAPDTGKQVDRALDGSEKALRQALELDESCGECFALLSAITGLRIGRNPLSGIWRGRRFQRQAGRALELSPENPRVHYLLGTNYYHAPERMGGKSRARKHFLKAAAFYEEERRKEAGELEPRWGYDTTLLFLGDLHREEGEREKAREFYLRALSANPANQKARMALEGLKNVPARESETR